MILSRMDNGIELLQLGNKALYVELAPAIGGKFTSIYNKLLHKEFLWRNLRLPLEKLSPGADYDSAFWGGIDELLPNDVPETVEGIDYPDHGELWTTSLDYYAGESFVKLSGLLPKSGLQYEKTVRLIGDQPRIGVEYCIRNTTREHRHFLWKLHAALKIGAGDRLVTPAKKGRIVYPASSRFTDEKEFSWPVIQNVDASIVPEKNQTMDFFYLYDVDRGEMSLLSKDGQSSFSYWYDTNVFPYQWYFASYGQFNDHYTAILEPATAMPVSVSEAARLNQCSVLAPGAELRTRVEIFAGRQI